jgi:hypothetical protein
LAGEAAFPESPAEAAAFRGFLAVRECQDFPVFRKRSEYDDGSDRNT